MSSLYIIIIHVLPVLTCIFLLHFLSTHKTQYESSPYLHFASYNNTHSDMVYDIYSILSKNEFLNDTLDQLRQTLFFKIFKINLEPDCTIFPEQHICKSSACNIFSCNNMEVPDIWKQPQSKDDPINVNIDDPFYKWVEKFSLSEKQWLVESDVESKQGTFVNLLKNPEGYTGYRGSHIWDAIFRENCFSDKIPQLCTEDKTFFRIFSGWLSNTNMQIGINYHNRDTNETYLNVSMLTSKLLMHREKVDNLFFLYSLVVKAVHKAKHIILEYDYHSGNEMEDKRTLDLLRLVYESPGKEVEFLNEAFTETTEDFGHFMRSKKLTELVARFRNISSIIDCVSCSKCRMHAKLEVFGISTMLKIMFASVEELKTNIMRNEVVSFINLFAKLSKTISYIKMIDGNINKAKEKYFWKQCGVVGGCVLMMVIIRWLCGRRSNREDKENGKMKGNKKENNDKEGNSSSSKQKVTKKKKE